MRTCQESIDGFTIKVNGNSLFRESAVSASLKGQFLVAANHLRDANFYRSVVLVLEHNDEGTMGLVINRPSEVSVETALSTNLPLVGTDTAVFSGGPVETSALMILHNSRILGKTDEQIVPGIYLAGSQNSFDSLVQQPDEPQPDIRFRVYCGYAGWGAQQLEVELGRGDWHVVSADSELVLDNDPYGVWDVCVRRLHRANRILPHDVRNPEWN
jgi:putative transcriptional regulator